MRIAARVSEDLPPPPCPECQKQMAVVQAPGGKAFACLNCGHVVAYARPRPGLRPPPTSGG
jgi:hypothetical protein